ncbi:MAG: UDP-N-acetylmuramoylalanyl-D-glutamyl-2,6-diaminopimelate--D-alanyl-D-alanyl ligase [Candidatus Taylorbacteria bacterium]|nr:UDP-N-acetylmuramoylalanyl-D-glutamyl-2,6-diaminopimelate--D-alanyl-D-alanyl ligase [Candidatus Taylorbacteria bacterium]
MKSLIKNIISVILEIECRFVLKKYKPSIIVVTGSNGKTSTKDAIYTVLSSAKNAASDSSGMKQRGIRRSEKSFNSELGVPLTILGCDNPWGSIIGWLGVISHGIELIIFKTEFPSTLILEVGADRPGDIKRVARWIKPDISVVTKIGKVPVHIEFFPTREALVEEKLALARVNKPQGKLVLPADDADILAVRKDNPVGALTYGVDVHADVSATYVDAIYADRTDETGGVIRVPAGVSFKLNYLGNSVPVRIMGVLGVQHVYPLVAAAAVGFARGMTLTAVIESFGEHKPPAGRMNVLEGKNGSTIIDDTYNASPDAVTEALATLRGVKVSDEGRKMAVLGDMMELGKFSQDEHKKIGALVAEILMGECLRDGLKDGIAKEGGISSCTVGALASRNLLVTVGQRAKMIRDGAIDAGMPESAILSFDSSAEAGAEIAKIVQKGDIVLVKGSQSPRMERVSYALLIDQKRAAELLVRQDAEWLAKK